MDSTKEPEKPNDSPTQETQDEATGQQKGPEDDNPHLILERHMDYDLGMCLGYNMPLHVIGGRKTKCKRLDNTPRPEIKEDWSGY